MRGDGSGKPRLVHIISNLAVGGAEELILRLLTELRDRFEVSVVCIRATGPLAPEFEAAGIPLTLIRFKNRWSPIGLWRLARFLRGMRADIVQTHKYGANISGIAGARLAGVPVRISTVHAMQHWRLGRRVHVDRALIPWRDAVVCVSESVRGEYLSETACPPDACRVVYNGVDLTRFEQPSRREAIRDELGIPRDVPVVGNVARLVPLKNHRAFLHMAAAIRARRPETRFLVVGEGPLRGDLEAEAGSLGLAGVVHFTGSRRDVPDLLGAMDCFLLTSRLEGFGLVVVEAMAAGVPVVASDLGSLREILRPPEAGLVFPAGDVEAGANRVLGLLDDDALRIRLRNGGHARSRDFAIERMGEEMTRLYHELLQGKRGVHA